MAFSSSTPAALTAFRVWASAAPRNGSGAPGQSPTDELLAEHYVMTGLLSAMEGEARRLDAGEPLRASIWAGIVDFNGNFVHLCHRVKEEENFVPALIAADLFDPTIVDAIKGEHQNAKDLTLGIRDGVMEGDWEMVFRLVSMYLGFLPAYMQKEEAGIFALARRLPEDASQSLRDAFDAVEAEALADSGRPHYLDIAQAAAGFAAVQSDPELGLARRIGRTSCEVARSDNTEFW